MSPRKPPRTDTNPAAEDDGLTDEVRELRRDVCELRDEVRVLRESIDEFRGSFEHAVRNLPDRLPALIRVWSLPSDPTAPDFGDRINAVPPGVMEQLRDKAAGGNGTDTPEAAAEEEPRGNRTGQAAVPSPRASAARGPQGRLF